MLLLFHVLYSQFRHLLKTNIFLFKVVEGNRNIFKSLDYVYFRINFLCFLYTNIRIKKYIYIQGRKEKFRTSFLDINKKKIPPPWLTGPKGNNKCIVIFGKMFLNLRKPTKVNYREFTVV